ncbi:MAG TPA: hypothetical protein VNX22_09235 [Acidobacteriaceae bacterium]|jgi:hypothetical protein|nr:hypothetical protein [Acidobacteriaceae bacterium]
MAMAKFTTMELESLRNELMQSGLDRWQSAELVSSFLIGRGYGVSREHAVDAASKIEGMGCNLTCMEQELERIALVM